MLSMLYQFFFIDSSLNAETAMEHKALRKDVKEAFVLVSQGFSYTLPKSHDSRTHWG